MERAYSILRLYRRSSTLSNGGKCDGSCDFMREGQLLFCDFHNRFIDSSKHELLRECSLDSCHFVVERDKGRLVCPVSGQLFGYEVSEETNYKYNWCTGIENQQLNGEKEEEEEEHEEQEQQEMEQVNKRKGTELKKKNKDKEEGEDEREEGEEEREEEDGEGEGRKKKKKRSKRIPTSRMDEASGRKKEILEHLRDSMLTTVYGVVNFITVNVSDATKEEMVHAACHAFSIMNNLNPPSLSMFPLKTFAALFFQICFDETLPVKGAICLSGVSFPTNFTNPAKWHGKLGEAKTRALSRKQLLLRDLVKIHPEIVQIKNYKPFIVPHQAFEWGKDLLNYKC